MNDGPDDLNARGSDKSDLVRDVVKCSLFDPSRTTNQLFRVFDACDRLANAVPRANTTDLVGNLVLARIFSHPMASRRA
jgi:hypothetical protein